MTSPLDIPTDTLTHARIRADAVADLDIDDSYLRWSLRLIRTCGRVFLPRNGYGYGNGNGDGDGNGNGDGYGHGNGYGYGYGNGYGDGDGNGDGDGYGHGYGYGDGYGNGYGWRKGVFFPLEAAQ